MNEQRIVVGRERISLALLHEQTGETETVLCSEHLAMDNIENYTVGDVVQISRDESSRITRIERCPRAGVLVRFRSDRTRKSDVGGEEHVIAANIDIVVIVVAANRVQPRLIDRYLVLAEYGDVAPIICVNKIDVVSSTKRAETIESIEKNLQPYEALSIPLVYVSAKTGAHIAQLRAALQEKTAVFCGHSGVGKSSLVNVLLGEEVAAVGGVRSADGRGRHTTTSSTLRVGAHGMRIIDTPGIRQLEHLAQENPLLLRQYFPEFLVFQDECRYRNCTHIIEPDCAVRRVVEEDRERTAPRIAASRYESYVRLTGNDPV